MFDIHEKNVTVIAFKIKYFCRNVSFFGIFWNPESYTNCSDRIAYLNSIIHFMFYSE